MANVITEQGDLGLGLYDMDEKIYNEAVKESNTPKEEDKDEENK